MQDVEYLVNKEYLQLHSKVLDIGSQNLHNVTPERARRFVEKYGRITDEAAFKTAADRLSYYSTPRPGEPMTYLSELLDLTSIDYTSYDVCEAVKTEIFDLNFESVPDRYRGYFDIVLNFGTTEHVINQMNCMKVMHDAAALNGIMVHQLPSTGWEGHGYFCYHAELFQDLARSNDYDILDLWYIPTGECWFDALQVDVRDPMLPEQPHSANHDSNRRFAPSHNLNVVLRKRVDRPFNLALELMTSHAGIAEDISARYSGAPGMPAQPLTENATETDLSQHYRYVSGRLLLQECLRRVRRRLRLFASPPSDRHPATDASQRVKAGAQITQRLPVADPGSARSALREASTDITTLREPYAVDDIARWLQDPAASSSSSLHKFDDENRSLSAKHFYELGAAAREAGQQDIAFKHFARSNSLIPRYPRTRDALQLMAEECVRSSEGCRGDEQRICLLTRAVEMDPSRSDAREQLSTLIEKYSVPDLTRMCFVFPDVERATGIHTAAYKRAIEFITLGGIVGDIFEFGVLGGWSARLLAETMRDTFNLNNLHLFDSFEGLPQYVSEIDRQSFEIAGRNLWADRMKFPSDFVAQFDEPHHLHIQNRISEVIRAERVFLHKGFFSETLPDLGSLKAALVHLDCDLYWSSVEVLGYLFLGDILQDGTVLLFDDWNCNRANPEYGQRRAFHEFLEKQNRFTSSFWYNYGFNGAAYILHQTSRS